MILPDSLLVDSTIHTMARHGQYNPQPPIILALENSTSCGSLALVCADLCISEYSLTSNATHSKRLIASIDMIMHESGFEWRQIDAIAVSLGPGSFTGLRIALSTVKGLIMASEKKLIGVASLDGLAQQLFCTEGLICPVLDARKKEVYTAFYRADNSGIPQRIGDYFAITPEELSATITEPVTFVGDGTILYKEIFTNILGDKARFAPHQQFFPKASSIGALALTKYHERDFLSPLTATPIYVRASDAEITFKGN